MKALKIILGIIFFQIAVYIIIWKSQKFSKKVKIALTAAWTVFLLILSSFAGGSESDTESDTEPVASIVTTIAEEVTEPVTEATETPTPKPTEKPTKKPSELPHGDLIDLKETELDDRTIIVLKAKITPSMTNKLTIDQNYMNACEWLQKHDNKCDEFQYWAVADMQDGSEGKVISFTLNAETVEGIRNKNIVDIQIPDYAEDLWILPSLK